MNTGVLNVMGNLTLVHMCRLIILEIFPDDMLVLFLILFSRVFNNAWFVN
jgi:hypothetical protein